MISTGARLQVLAPAALAALAALAAFSPASLASDVDPSATTLDLSKPILWRDYDILKRGLMICIASTQPETYTQSVCERISRNLTRASWAALKQADEINSLTGTGPKYCARHVSELIGQSRDDAGAGMAGYLIEYQLRGTNGPYGDALPGIYLGQIVHDALVRISPCKPPEPATGQ